MKISIITVTYNSVGTIRRCVESVLMQTLKDVQYIVIDGESTDGTKEYIFRNKASFAKILVETDYGIYDAMNKGIALAEGEIIGFLNSDDCYSSNEVLALVEDKMAREDADTCYGDLVFVDPIEPDRTVRYWKAGEYTERSFYWGWMPPHPTFFVKRAIYNKYGGFRLQMGSAADYELMLRFLLRYRCKSVYIPRTLVRMSLGGISNANIKTRLRANRMDKKAWEINALKPLPWTLLFKPLRKVPQWILMGRGSPAIKPRGMSLP